MDSRAVGGRFGAEFDGQTLVTSVNIGQQLSNNSVRQKIEWMNVYANGVLVGEVKLADTYAAQPNMPIWAVGTKAQLAVDPMATPVQVHVTATWLTFVVTSQYKATGANNFAAGGQISYGTYTDKTPTGLLSYSGTGLLNGTPADTLHSKNLNLKTSVQATTMVVPTNLSYGSGKQFNVVDGRLVAANSTDDSIYWSRGGAGSGTLGAQSLTVYYDGLETVRSVGIGLAGDGSAGAQWVRDTPRWVIISGGTGMSGSETELYNAKIWLTPELVQYNRYDLMDWDAKVDFAGIEWLRITFPTSTSNNNAQTSPDLEDWWIGSNRDFGLNEFQAFDYYKPQGFATPIPEPATMSLLVLGGLALLRRRGR